MNRKQITILLVLVVVLGGAGLLLRNRQASSWQGANPEMGKKLLGDFPVNDVTQISVKQGTNELNLAKKEDVWRVRERNDYPANYSEISDFLIKLKDLKVVRSEEVGASQLPRLALVPGEGSNAATVVEFKDQGGKVIRSLLLGKKHMRKSNRPSPFGDMGGDEGWPDGRYVKVGTGAGNVALISDAMANAEPKPEQWLSKDFVKVEKVRSIAVNFPQATNSWAMTRETETAEWKLADLKAGEQLDTSKASSAANALSSPTFTDVATGLKPEELGGGQPTVATLETFDGFAYTVKVGQKTNDNYPVAIAVNAQLATERTPGKDEKPEDKDKLDKEFKEKRTKLEEKLASEKAFANWVYLVSSWSVESLLKERHQMLVEKKEEKKDDGKATDAAADAAASMIAPPADDAGGDEDEQDADADSEKK